MILKSMPTAASIIATVVFTAATLAQSPGAAPPPQAAKAGFTKLAVNEDFSTFDLRNPSKDATYWHIYPFRMDVSDSLIYVKDGVLNLMTGPHHGTAMIIKTMAPPDEPQHEYGFGYYEARLKFNPTADNAPSFWLESQHGNKLGNRTDVDPEETRFCEIDVMELNYTKPGMYMGTVHDWYMHKSTYNHPNIYQPPPGTDLSAWNTFGVLWQPGKISWYVNDKFVASAHSPRICDRQQLSIVLSSHKQFPDSPDQLLQVNWVHVYQ